MIIPKITNPRIVILISPFLVSISKYSGKFFPVTFLCNLERATQIPPVTQDELLGHKD